jgi:hypothetical protein
MLVALERQVERVAGPPTRAQVMDDWASVLTQRDLLLQVFRETAPNAFRDREIEEVTEHCRRRNEELTSWLQGDFEAPAELDEEDDALLLRAWQLRVGPLRAGQKARLEYRHIAIDEVQDFSPTEVRILIDCLDEHRSLTLAGDTQQHVMQDAGFTSWSEFFEHLKIERTDVDTLPPNSPRRCSEACERRTSRSSRRAPGHRWSSFSTRTKEPASRLSPMR